MPHCFLCLLPCVQCCRHGCHRAFLHAALAPALRVARGWGLAAPLAGMMNPCAGMLNHGAWADRSKLPEGAGQEIPRWACSHHLQRPVRGDFARRSRSCTTSRLPHVPLSGSCCDLFMCPPPVPLCITLYVALHVRSILLFCMDHLSWAGNCTPIFCEA